MSAYRYIRQPNAGGQTVQSIISFGRGFVAVWTLTRRGLNTNTTRFRPHIELQNRSERMEKHTRKRERTGGLNAPEV